MCASNHIKMDPDLLSRFNSTSTSKTLVSSGDGSIPPTPSPLAIIDEKLQTAGPIIQTRDNKQWIDLDSISPKLLRELRRQYEVSEDGKKPLAKGAAKIKAWIRHTKLGFDLRLSRNINAEREEITDFCLVREDAKSTDAGAPSLSEMPENTIFELPDTSIMSELSTIQTTHSRDEPLPKYEPPPGQAVQARPQLRLQTTLPQSETMPERSPSESSIVATPTKGLSLTDEFAPQEATTSSDPYEMQYERERNTKEEVQALLKVLKDQLSMKANDEGLKVIQTKRYDVETDAELEESPRKRSERVAAPSRKKRTIKLKGSLKRNSVHTRTGHDASDLPRRLTLPPRVQTSDGAEAAWTAVLKAQAKILGAEHPLIWSSKHAMSLSRVQHHRNCPTSLVESLLQSERTAIQTLGQVHPLVEAFSANLRTLEDLILASPPPRIDETGETISTRDYARELTSPRGKDCPMRTSPWNSLPIIKTSFHLDSPQGEVKVPVTRNNLWDTWLPPHTPKNDLLVVSGMSLAAVTRTLKDGLSWLERTYGPEPAVEAGKSALRRLLGETPWRSKRTGGLSQPAKNEDRSPTSPTSSRSYSGSFNSSVGGTLSTNTSWSSYSQASNGTSSGEKQHAKTMSATMQYSPFVSIAEPPWLLVCTNEDRLTPKVTHLDVASHKITSNKDLAKTLREHYFEVNRKWSRKLRLRGLTTIEFVQFECHQNRFADIRKCPDMPPTGTGDYTFEPSELIPPVGNAYLKHLFNHPEDYDGELITYLRAPKKIARLQLGVGWGINMVEGFLADRVWLCATVFFVLASLVFGIAWACERNDIQGAFGVAQWICTLAVFAGGWLQACLG